MRYRLFLVVFAAAISATGQATGPPRPSAEEQKRILADATQYAMNQEKNLPNFICTQTTQRFVDFTGKDGFRPVDLIVERLTYFENHENYKVDMVNGQPSSLSHRELGGAISSGEFGSIMKGIFWADSQTQFQWDTLFKLRGRKTHVYSYQVPAARSDYHIVVPIKKLDLVAAYHGKVFIDDTRHYVYRITLHADGIPPGFPVQDVSLALDYDYVRIGEGDYVLPLEFELRSREGARLIKNSVTYENYRKFGADSSVKFDAPAGIGQKPDQK